MFHYVVMHIHYAAESTSSDITQAIQLWMNLMSSCINFSKQLYEHKLATIIVGSEANNCTLRGSNLSFFL